MNRNESLLQMARGINADLGDYAKLKRLQQAQFDAALQHRPADLTALAEAISALTEVLEARRQQRVELAAGLLPGGGEKAERSMNDVFALLPESSYRMVGAWWQQLEELVRECQVQNRRTCQLLMDQHEIMQRVLDGENDVYVQG